MAHQVTRPGRLISIDGSRGKDVTAAADDAVAELKRAGVDCAISRWDASGLFTDLAASGRGGRGISVRTLSLVFAADLAFRIRWEIRPILEAGGVVIAAPYLDTAAAFAAAFDLDQQWFRLLMRFAPLPDARCRAVERKVDRPWKQRRDRGYPEYGALMLAESASAKTAKSARRRMIASLDEARGRRVFHLTGKGLAAMATAITDSRTAAPRRSASRPHSGRS